MKNVFFLFLFSGFLTCKGQADSAYKITPDAFDTAIAGNKVQVLDVEVGAERGSLCADLIACTQELRDIGATEAVDALLRIADDCQPTGKRAKKAPVGRLLLWVGGDPYRRRHAHGRG